MTNSDPDMAGAAPDVAVEVEALAAERLAFFSDAVVAIAITLLALGLPIPTGATNAELLHNAGQDLNDYLAFLVSFVVIARHWYGHHRVFRWVVRLGGSIRLWDMLWLLGIVVTPFATRVLTGDGAFQSRFIFYALVQTTVGFAFMMMLHNITARRLLRPGAPPTLLRDSYDGLIGMSLAFLLSIPVSFVTHWAYLLWVAIPFTSRGARWFLDRFAPNVGRV